MSSDSQRKLDDERRQFAEKREAVTDWEEQIKEIIQWLVLLTSIISFISFNRLIDFSRQFVTRLYTTNRYSFLNLFFFKKICIAHENDELSCKLSRSPMTTCKSVKVFQSHVKRGTFQKYL